MTIKSTRNPYTPLTNTGGGSARPPFSRGVMVADSNPEPDPFDRSLSWNRYQDISNQNYGSGMGRVRNPGLRGGYSGQGKLFTPGVEQKRKQRNV